MSDQVEVHNEFEGGEREWTTVAKWIVYDKYAWETSRKTKRLALTWEDVDRARLEVMLSAATAWHERPLDRGVRDYLTGNPSIDKVIRRVARMPLAIENHPNYPGKKCFSETAAMWLAKQFVETKTTKECRGPEMDDSCGLEMTLRKVDVALFAPFVLLEPGDKWISNDTENHGLVHIRADDADYGWGFERREAAKAGIPFHGTHEHGCEYGPSAFVSLDGEMIEVNLDRYGNTVIAIGESMKQNEGAMALLRAYHEKLKAVKKLFGEED